MKSGREKRKADPPAAGAQMPADNSDADLCAPAHWDAGGTRLGQPTMRSVLVGFGAGGNQFAPPH